MKKNIIIVFPILCILLISSFFIFKSINKKTTLSQTPQQKSVNYKGWDKKNSPMNFWFPKNNVVISQKTNNYYTFSYQKTIVLSSPLNKDAVEKEISNQKSEILIPVNSLKEQGYVLNKEMTGLFNADANKMVPYYLQTFQKDNNWCQLATIFECSGKECLSSGANFSCFNFDFKKTFSEQNSYYKTISKISDYKQTGYAESITEVQTNYLGYKKIILSSWIDGNIIIIDKNNEPICQSKACCDESSQDIKELWGNSWCQNYETIDAYKTQN